MSMTRCVAGVMASDQLEIAKGTTIPDDLPVVSLLGGLAADSDVPMPEDMVEYLKRTWDRIQSTCGVTFNHTYWDQTPPPPRTTYISCRAVIAAERLAGRGEAFGERIQMPITRKRVTFGTLKPYVTWLSRLDFVMTAGGSTSI